MTESQAANWIAGFGVLLLICVYYAVIGGLIKFFAWWADKCEEDGRRRRL